MVPAGLALAFGLTVQPLTRAADKEGVVIEMDGLRSKAPADWKEMMPGRGRYAQFKLPAQKGDKYDGELIIFKGFGGSAKDNIDRWKKQFIAPEGKTIDDVAKVEEMKIGGHTATYLDVQGTYLLKSRPFDPDEKPEKRENYRMLAVQFDGPDNVYHIKLFGPEKTIEAAKKDFEGWLKGFKKD
jgi:hypothetical protein